MLHLASAAALLVLTAAGCSPALATMQPARITPRGHWEITTAVGGSLIAGDPMDRLLELEDIEVVQMITGDQARTISRGGAVLFTQPPGLNAYVSTAYGVSDRLELGLRGSADSARGFMRLQFLRSDQGFYGALGLGFTTFFAGFPVEKFTDLVELNDYSRREMDMPIHVGISGEVGHLWLGPKFIFSDYRFEQALCPEPDQTCSIPGTTGVSGTISYLGGQIGGAIGYKALWFALELTLMETSLHADLDIDIQDTKEIRRFNIDGMVVNPAVGLILWL